MLLKFVETLISYKFPQRILKVTSLSFFSFRKEIGMKGGGKEGEGGREREQNKRKRKEIDIIAKFLT